jgi:hypothetical protein
MAATLPLIFSFLAEWDSSSGRFVNPAPALRIHQQGGETIARMTAHSSSLRHWSTCFAIVIAAGMVGSPTSAQSPTATAAVRVATPDEVRQRLEAEAAAIAAETPFDGFDGALTHYIRTTLPSLEPVSRENALAYLGASTADFAATSPFVCQGDFTGEGLQHTVAIMHDRNTDELVLMAFHQIHVFVNPGPTETLGYSSYTLHKIGPLREPRRLDEIALACREPGSFQSVDGSVTLTLANHSIGFGYIEYYFVDGAYQSLIIGD